MRQVHALVDEVRQDADAIAVELLAVDEAAGIGLVQALERHLSVRPLDRVERVWDLSAAQAASLFGVSRQAYAKWREAGVPASRREDVAELDAATQVLLAHVKVDRIPAVVRRASPMLQDRSLLDVAVGDPAATHAAVVDMFDLRRVQP